MDISKNTDLIEALLIEDIPDCNADSEVEDSDDEIPTNLELPTSRGFDEVFEEALARLEETGLLAGEEAEEEQSSVNPSEEITTPTTSPRAPTTIRRNTTKQQEPNRKWKKRDLETRLPAFTENTGAVEEFFSTCTSPTEFFLAIIDPILENIVYQTNLYATQREKVLNLKKEELLAFIGINFYMGYNTRPAWTDHYSSAPDLHNALICQTMPRDRFAAILSFLHCNDNTNMPPNCKDKLYKLRPMIDELNRKFQECYYGTREMSVDESMIKFKGRSVLKQYLPMKPIKRGYKLWCLADQRGFIKRFIIYQGKEEELNAKFTEYSLGERVVLELTEKEWGKEKVIYFDKFFSSVHLLEKLKTHNTYACGTIRSNRKGLPENMTNDSKLKRGEYDYRFSNLDIGYWKWKDNKIVYIVSNFHGSENATVTRKEKDGTKSTITCSTAIRDYNKFMGGVDTADRFRALYCVDRKSKKWWHRIFFGLLDIAFVNAYVIYGLSYDKPSVKDFRRSVAQGLMTMKNIGIRKRTSTEAVPDSASGPSKRRKSDYSTLKDVRLGNRGIHWPKFEKTRGRCEVCSMKKIQSKPYTKCSHCNVYLCLNEKKNCFNEYHQVNV